MRCRGVFFRSGQIFADNFSRRAEPSCPDRFDERFDAHDGDEAFDIIGENREAHLCGDVFDAFGEEVARSHPAFECSKERKYL